MRFASHLGLGLAAMALSAVGLSGQAIGIPAMQIGKTDATAPVERKQRRGREHQSAFTGSHRYRSRREPAKPKKHPNRLRFRQKAKLARRRARKAA